MPELTKEVLVHDKIGEETKEKMGSALDIGHFMRGGGTSLNNPIT